MVKLNRTKLSDEERSILTWLEDLHWSRSLWRRLAQSGTGTSSRTALGNLCCQGGCACSLADRGNQLAIDICRNGVYQTERRPAWHDGKRATCHVGKIDS